MVADDPQYFRHPGLNTLRYDTPAVVPPAVNPAALPLLGAVNAAAQLPANPLAACSATLPLQSADLLALMSDNGAFVE